MPLAVTGLCASSLSLVIWSRELKHCSVEALVSVLAALLVFQTRRSAGGPRRWALGAALAALALVAPWVAYGALLPLGTLIPVLFLRKPVPGSRRGVAVIGAVSAAALLIGGSTVWHLAARAQAGQPALVRYASIWAIRPLDPESWRMPLGSFASATTRLFCPPGWFRPEQTQRGDIALAAAALVIWTVAVLGLWAWPRHGRRELTWWLLAPPLAMLAASVVFHYPFGCARMMQFWAPPMVIAVCAGLVTLWRSLLVFVCRRGAPALLSGILAGALPAAVVFQHARQHCHYYYHDFPTVLRTLNDQRARGEPVFVELLAAPSVRYYAPELAAPIIFTPIAIGVLAPETVDVRPLVESLLRHATRRTWIVAMDEGPRPDRPPGPVSHTARRLFPPRRPARGRADRIRGRRTTRPGHAALNSPLHHFPSHHSRRRHVPTFDPRGMMPAGRFGPPRPTPPRRSCWR